MDRRLACRPDLRQWQYRQIVDSIRYFHYYPEAIAEIELGAKRNESCSN